jgi:3-oxoacyl-[acyl-carrier-protein] synthase II
MAKELHRVVVTGMSAIVPLGNNLDQYWDGLVNGRSGIGPITKFDATGFASTIAGEVKDFDPGEYISPKETRKMDLSAQYAVVAGQDAVKHAGLEITDDNADRIGVIIGTGVGGIKSFEDQHTILVDKGPRRLSPFMIPLIIVDMPAGQLSMAIGAKGPNYATVSACASAAHAIGNSMTHIMLGQADVMITGGTDAAICPMGIGGFCAARALSTRNDDPEHASRPFDVDRDGFVGGEGCATLVLESLEHAQARGANILAELVGYGFSADAYHLTAPSKNGEGMTRSMKAALELAEMDPSDVDYVNAHGTSTRPGDPAESAAIRTAFGGHADNLAVTSTKSMIGHLLGAAGAAEMVATILTIQNGIIPPTANLENPDPACDLDYVPRVAREKTVNVALSNSFGFGGHNASLIVRAWK